MIEIGRDGSLGLPFEQTVTETFGILGIRGSGKTTTARVLVEEITAHGGRSIIIDPLGVWWGLRSSADGQADGLPFTIFGGDHADVDITSTSGDVVAAFLVDHEVPAVIDLSLMRKGEQRRFMTAFVDRLYHSNRRPVHVVVDECDLYIPQRTIRGTEQLVGAMEDIVRRGRVKGIGVTLITQRPASVHKDVLSQVAVLVAHRLVGPHDRKAIDSWVEAHGTTAQRDEMMKRLAGLPTGTAWFWSPSWLDVFAEIPVRAPSTFDSSATPKHGEAAMSTRFASVDVTVLREQLADVQAEAEQNDPRALQRRIAELERQLAVATPERVEVEVPVLPPFHDQHLDKLSEIEAILNDARVDLDELISEMMRDADNMPAVMGRSDDPTMTITVAKPARARAVPGQAVRDETSGHSPRARVDDARAFTKAESAILAVLAQHQNGRTRTQLALLTGYSVKSSSLSNALGSLRSDGLVDKGNPIRLTDAGRSNAGDVPALPTGDALYDHWRARLGKAEIAVLDAFRTHGHLDRDRLADITGYSSTSSSLSNALGKLRSLDLVDGWQLHPDFANAIAVGGRR